MTPWLLSTIKFKKIDKIPQNFKEKLLNSADATAEIIKTAYDLKALNSRIPKILDFIRIAKFSPKVQFALGTYKISFW